MDWIRMGRELWHKKEAGSAEKCRRKASIVSGVLGKMLLAEESLAGSGKSGDQGEEQVIWRLHGPTDPFRCTLRQRAIQQPCAKWEGDTVGIIVAKKSTSPAKLAQGMGHG